MGPDRVGASGHAGLRPVGGDALDARSAAPARPSPAGPGAPGRGRGQALDAERGQRAARERAVRGHSRRAVPRARPAGARGAAPDRRDPPARGPRRAALGGRWRGQAARCLRPCGATDHLLRGDAGAGQRRDCGQVLALRAGRHLRVRQRLLLLRLLGEAGRRGLLLRHPAEGQHAGADHARGSCPRPRAPSWPTRSGTGPSAWPPAGAIPSSGRCGR